MTFREQLGIVSELGFSICDIDIANEADCVFDFEYTDDEFEQLCSLMRDAYLKAEDMTVFALAKTINDLIIYDNNDRDPLTIKDVLDISTWDLIEKASYYL